jgi:serine/threonine protein kinase
MDDKVIEYINEQGDLKIVRNISKLGEGSYGVVYKALLDGFGEVAVKYQSFITEDQVISALLEYEKAPMLQKHSIVVRKIIVSPELKEQFPALNIPSVAVANMPLDYKIIFLYDLVVGMDLFDIIKLQRRSVPFTVETLKHYSIQLLEGIIEIRDADLVHRDIKPENIMLHNGIIKYIDFGMVCDIFAPKKCSGLKGTASFVSPILARSVDFSNLDPVDLFDSDSYAVGMTIMNMIGKLPTADLLDPIDYFRAHSLPQIYDYLKSSIRGILLMHDRFDFFPAIWGLVKIASMSYEDAIKLIESIS